MSDAEFETADGRATLLCGDGAAWHRFAAWARAPIRAAVAAALTRAGRYSSHLTDDCEQIVLLRLLEGEYRLLRSYDPGRAGFGTWLRVVAYSTAQNELRRRHEAPLGDDVESMPGPAGPVADDSLLDLRRDFAAARRRVLTARQELVLACLFDCDMDTAEVAGMLDLSAQTIRSAKHKALTRLRRYFAE